MEHWNQNRSSFRTGEPEDHKRAKNIVVNALESLGMTAHKEYPLVDSLVKGYKHGYDVVGFGRLVIVEVDDEALHSKPRKVRNDKIAMNHALENFPHASFIRLDKDTLNDKEYVSEYLNTDLFDKI